jgi:long-chain acyl-CoA synthetase
MNKIFLLMKKNICEYLEFNLNTRTQENVFWKKEHTTWVPTNWNSFKEQYFKLASFLVDLGIKKGDVIAISSNVRLEWTLVELAILKAGGVVIGIDNKSSEEDFKKIIQKSKVKKLIIENQEILDKIPLKKEILFSIDLIKESNIKTLNDILLQKNSNKVIFPEIKKDDFASIIHTSGTTGDIKFIRYSHGQIMYAIENITKFLKSEAKGIKKTICWLPLSHLTSRILNISNLFLGVQTYFVNDPKEIINSLTEVSPEYIFGVPRFFEKIEEKFQTILTQKKLFSALFHFCLFLKNKKLFVRHVDKYFFNKIKKKLFGNNLLFTLSGSAQVNETILTFFKNLNVTILEGYGMSENLIPIGMNTRDHFKFGTVGRLIPGNTIKFSKEGEILVKGKGVFTGYLDTNNNDLFDNEGYLYTGDLGVLDRNGYLTLIGRKKEIIKTSTGLKISPIRIESVYKKSPFVQDCVVFGNNRKYLTALFTLNQDYLGFWCQKNKITLDIKEVLKNKLFLNSFKKYLDKFESELASFEKVVDFHILEDNFSSESGELTTSLKIKRLVIEKKYHMYINELYKK